MSGCRGQGKGLGWRPVLRSVVPDPNIRFATSKDERAAGVKPELLSDRDTLSGWQAGMLHFK
ncbi:hypothetical protein CHLRE_02g145630v5 [Chlamydomonas reinhardtii]|uniref:Uncharacterized protein n=1 Tax=Chlamydomonas reinhardtii TaxID=3055 RepID=A0A2K3E3T9_CHLRE|nr:uncharacterized protein CHLRE_02g145630v5 [Chlamydomonas reinhardtii]PNW87433.1 hypothetical protein CHLRE_02g145630v5 [Chlamydomonas reinhardtii]